MSDTPLGSTNNINIPAHLEKMKVSDLMLPDQEWDLNHVKIFALDGYY